MAESRKKRKAARTQRAEVSAGPAAKGATATEAGGHSPAGQGVSRAASKKGGTKPARNGNAARSQRAQQPARSVVDPCGASRRCGACQHIAQPYNQQLAVKDAWVRDLFVQAGIVPSAESAVFQPIKGMADPRFYRNKVISPFARGKRLADGKHGARYQINTGMYAAHSHKVVDTSGCLIENQQAKQVIAEVKHLMGKFGIEPYDEDTGAGFMRHAVVRVGHESGEVLVTLVTNDDTFPASRSFCRELVRRCPFITTVVQNVNTRQTNVILGQKEHCLYGPGFILDTLCGLSFRISSQSFYQVNSTQTEVLYNTAIQLAGLDGIQDVIDAYCGTGTIGLVAASRGAKSVTGVDAVESSIRDARNNAAHNGIKNACFVAGDAGAFMRELAADGVGAPQGSLSVDGGSVDRANLVVFMDPPRAGSTEEFLDALGELAPQRVVYISCNAQTQVRDIAYLQRYGYAAQTVVPVDMFPHTDHVETIALLTRER